MILQSATLRRSLSSLIIAGSALLWHGPAVAMAVDTPVAPPVVHLSDPTVTIDVSQMAMDPVMVANLKRKFERREPPSAATWAWNILLPGVAQASLGNTWEGITYMGVWAAGVSVLTWSLVTGQLIYWPAMSGLVLAIDYGWSIVDAVGLTAHKRRHWDDDALLPGAVAHQPPTMVQVALPVARF